MKLGMKCSIKDLVKGSVAFILAGILLQDLGPFAFAAAESTSIPIVTEEVRYKVNGVALNGYFAKPKEIKEKVPGILVIHEWWGHNEYARRRARMLAELGYAAFALDLYGNGKVSEHPADAKHFMEDAVNSGQIPARFDAALNALTADPQVDASEVAAIGYCFGGRVAIQMAEQGKPLKGIVSFHGPLPVDRSIKKGSVKAKLLVLNGQDDVMIPSKDIETFKKQMKEAGADYQFINYPGAKHGFTDPDASKRGQKSKMPIEYNAAADKKSWEEMKTFLKKVLK